MPFTPVPQITINGSPQAFNGYVYNLDYDISVSSEPSKLTLHFVSEDGSYFDPVLSVRNPYRIAIGSTIDENFYAISYTKENSATQGKTLTVTFVDGSIALDRLWIGLHKHHGSNPNASRHITNIEGFIPNPYPLPQVDTEGTDPKLIILGSEQHSCDINRDGVFDAEDIPLLVYGDTDHCQVRCPTDTSDVNSLVNQCLSEAKTGIMDVKYRFSELIEALSTKFTVRNAPSIENDDVFLNAHTGSARDVLRTWCSELGLNFFWEKDGLTFFDVSQKPQIAVPSFECVESSSYTKTLEGTVSRGAITNYSQPGRILDKTCNQDLVISLRCLTLADLFSNPYKPDYSEGFSGSPSSGDDPGEPPPSSTTEEYVDSVFTTGIPLDLFEESCVCSFYSDSLRKVYILRNYYGLQTVSDYVGAVNKRLDRFGGLQILKVLDSTISNTTKYKRLMGPAIDILGNSQEDKTFFKKNKGFFIIAKLNPDKLDAQFRREEHLAAQFIGRHWVRGYHAPYYGAEPTFDPPCQYLGASGMEIKRSDFAQFGHDNNSRVATLAKKMQELPGNSNQNVLKQHHQNRSDIKTLIYLSRANAVWGPELKDSVYLKTLLEKARDAAPRLVAAPPELLKTFLKTQITENKVTVEEIDNKRVFLLAVFPGEFAISSAFSNNPFEDNPLHRSTESSASVAYGLSSKRCISYTIAGVPIFMPAGSSVRFDLSAELMENINTYSNPTFNLAAPISSGSPSYRVVLSTSNSYHIEIPKIETVFVAPAPDADTLVLDYLPKSDLSDLTLRSLNNLQESCTPDMEVLREAHTEFNKNLAFSIVEPFESYEFTVPGIDLPSGSINVSSGLESLKIHIGDSGVSATYKIGNSLFTPIQPDKLARALEFKLINKTRRGPRFNTARPPKRA